MALYSDGTEKNVSNKVVYGTVDTSTVGEKKLSITYNDISIEVIVNVLGPTGIEIDTRHVKLKYDLNSKLDISNLIVYNVFASGLKKIANNYSIKILTSDGVEMSILSSFENIGEYIINVEVDGMFAEYKILVEENTSDSENPEPTPQPTPEPLFTVTFGYSGYHGGVKSIYEDSKVEDFIKTKDGYMFLGFSSPFSEWKQGDFIKYISCNQ